MAEKPCAALTSVDSWGGSKDIVADANRIAILRVASPNRRRRAAAAAKEETGQKLRDLTLARGELAELKKGLDAVTSSLGQNQVVPPLPDVLDQLDQNFENMRELVAQGLAHVSPPAAPLNDVQLVQGRPAAEHGELVAAAMRVEQEMTTFWQLLSASVDPPVLSVLQKLHSTVLQVSKDVAAQPAASEAVTAADIPPPDLDELLEALSVRHPALAREIGRTTATALKFEYIQACARRSDNQRRQEVWQALALEEKRDLAQVHGLSQGAQDAVFLKIVEQDRRQRQKLSEMEMPAVLPSPRLAVARNNSRGAPPPAASSRAEATRIPAFSLSPGSVRSRISEYERASSVTRSPKPAPRSLLRSPTSATPRRPGGPGRALASSEAAEPSRLAAWAGEESHSDEAPDLPRLAAWGPRLRQHASSPPGSPRQALAAGIVRDRIRMLNSSSAGAL